MKRFATCVAALATVPAALAGVEQAATGGQVGLAVACALLAVAAAATTAWITARVGRMTASAPAPFRYPGPARLGRPGRRGGGGWQ